jgi:hypothetical protein
MMAEGRGHAGQRRDRPDLASAIAVMTAMLSELLWPSAAPGPTSSPCRAGADDPGGLSGNWPDETV